VACSTALHLSQTGDSHPATYCQHELTSHRVQLSHRVTNCAHFTNAPHVTGQYNTLLKPLKQPEMQTSQAQRGTLSATCASCTQHEPRRTASHFPAILYRRKPTVAYSRCRIQHPQMLCRAAASRVQQLRLHNKAPHQAAELQRLLWHQLGATLPTRACLEMESIATCNRKEHRRRKCMAQ
jgi:hypothetical protein